MSQRMTGILFKNDICNDACVSGFILGSIFSECRERFAAVFPPLFLSHQTFSTSRSRAALLSCERYRMEQQNAVVEEKRRRIKAGNVL